MLLSPFLPLGILRHPFFLIRFPKCWDLTKFYALPCRDFVEYPKEVFMAYNRFFLPRDSGKNILDLSQMIPDLFLVLLFPGNTLDGMDNR